MLDGISELKAYLGGNASTETDQEPAVQAEPELRSTLLSHTEHTTSKNELLAELPPKAVVDRLIAKCFMHAEVLHFLFHAPTFQKQYDSFWRNPLDVSIMWLGTLFGLLCAGTYYECFAAGNPGQITAGAGVPAEVQEQGEIYRRKMVQCMVAGGYTRGVPFTIETIQLYLHVEFLGKPDSPTEFWLLIGVLVRLAYRLGYHRDGSHFPNISPFEAEMRRRRWCSIVQMDTMTSTQFGLPKMIDPAQADVARPHNLFDEDFEESTTKLPESRPITTVTPSLYLITKTNLFLVYGTVSEMSMPGVPANYAAVMDIDKTVDQAYDSIPPCFKMRSMTRSITDKPELIIQRVWIRLLHLRSKCVLHRQYLRAGRVDKRWAYSRGACIDSALEVLDLQQMLYQESLPYGRLYQDRWRLSSLIRQEYLLATAILCIDVYTDLELELTPGQKLPVDEQSRRRILSAFRVTLPLWQQESDESKEAKKATSALRVILDKADHLERERLYSGPRKLPGRNAEQGGNAFNFGNSTKITMSIPCADVATRTESSSSHARTTSHATEATSADWQPFTNFALMPQDQYDGIGYLTLSYDLQDFVSLMSRLSVRPLTTPKSNTSYDFAQTSFQAQDLMDIFQEDYPSIL